MFLFDTNVHKIIDIQHLLYNFFSGGYTTPYYATLFRGHRIKAIGYKSTLQKRDIDIL